MRKVPNIFMTPIEYYHEQCVRGLITEDPQQLVALQYAQTIYVALCAEEKCRSGFFSKWRTPKLVPGLYLYGGVGVGKTYLMDCFYTCIPFQQKMRMHFHAFMQWVHAELKKHQGKKNPITLIAKALAQKTMLLCFDELLVSDIADAMLLRHLLGALFAEGICIITTSNTAPDNLYYRGLQRDQFLPAIALLKLHTTVLHIPTTIDYRLRTLKEAGVFYTPNDHAALMQMENTFALLTDGEEMSEIPIEINNRLIHIQKRTQEVVWFDFKDICHIPRSYQDYLEIAKKYRTVFISNVPKISADEKNIIALLVRLVDVFYDAKIRLIISAAVPVEQIYMEGFMCTDFIRTHSRLLEMQTEMYFFKQ